MYGEGRYGVRRLLALVRGLGSEASVWHSKSAQVRPVPAVSSKADMQRFFGRHVRVVPN